MADQISVVLVDDAPEVRSLIRTRLRLSKRFDVLGEGATGADAVRLVAEHDPDLLVLDVSMPDMDGLDALRRVRDTSPRTCVVMFSGFEEHGLADRARELGAADFVEKSVPIDQIPARFAAAVERAGAEAPPFEDEPSIGEVPPVPPSPSSAVEPILQEHLERFRAAFDQAAIGMATLTLTGRVVRANAALELLVGAAPGALVGVPYEDLSADPADLREPVASVASGDRDAASVEHDLRSGRGVVSTVAVVRDSEHTPLYLFLQVQDVTERRAAEEELRRSEERFRLLVESVQDYAIFMLDPGGHIASWNLGAQRAKGYTADEIVGQHFSVFYPQEAVDAGHPQWELQEAIRDGRYEEEGWRIRKDGTRFWANVVITAVRDRTGELVGFAKVTRDVTERRRLLQELEAAAAERTQLLAVTAHELRTPVSVVNGFASMLRSSWDQLEEDDRREMLDSLHRGGQRLARLVEDLFTAARLESGAVEVRVGRVPLHVVAAEAIADIAHGRVELDAEPTTVLADRGRVQQMLANYLTNATRYGGGRISIEVRPTDGGMGELRVSDEGPGVADELVPKLFTKFAAGGTEEGTGLGLFIVRELARAQGGEAWYEPNDAGGATFALRLPLADPAA